MVVLSDDDRPESRAESFFISIHSASRRLNEAILASNQTIRHHHWVSCIELDPISHSASLASNGLT